MHLPILCANPRFGYSDGTATPEELNARHVKGVKLLFLPSADLKRNLEGLTFEVPPETPPA
jgi:hypothetical protein